MTTFADLIEESRLHLMTGMPDRLNVLQTTVDDTTKSIQLQQTVQGVGEGTTLAIDLEEMHVLSLSGPSAGGTATVIRGMNGSTKVSHDAGALVRVNPHFSDYRIGRFVNQSLHDLSARGLFQIKPFEFDFTPTRAGYEIVASDIIDIQEVRYDRPGPYQDWPKLRKDQWIFNQDAAIEDFPSGKSITLRWGGFPGHKVHVSYKARFGQMSALTDDVETTTGLHLEAHDIPPLWAAIRLLSGRDVKRSFLNRQPEPRRTEEVPPGAGQQSMETLENLLDQRLREERNRLKRQFREAA